jgi:hypothetical protein
MMRKFTLIAMAISMIVSAILAVAIKYESYLVFVVVAIIGVVFAGSKVGAWDKDNGDGYY